MTLSRFVALSVLLTWKASPLQYNALSRARQACVEAKDPACDMSNFTFFNFTRMLLK